MKIVFDFIYDADKFQKKSTYQAFIVKKSTFNT